MSVRVNIGKVFCVCDEYREIEDFISNLPNKSSLELIKSRLRFDTYFWNYKRLSRQLAEDFITEAAKDFERDMKNGFCLKELYPWHKWDRLTETIDLLHQKEEKQGFFKKIKRGIRCLFENGFWYTIKLVFKKLKRTLFKRSD